MAFRPIRSLVLVGAAGKMARLLAARAGEAGIAVAGLDRAYTDERARAALDGADCLCLCVPVTAVRQSVSRLAPLMSPPQVMIDICSVKTEPMAAMLDGYPGPVVGTHPLFGPAPAGETKVAVVPGRADEGNDVLAAIEDLIERLGFTHFRTSAAEHDKAMALIQGLNFVTTVAYLAAGIGVEGIERFVTPSFQRRLDAAKKLVLEDAPLFTALVDANPQSQEVVRSFQRYLSIAAGGDVDLLVKRAARWWDASGTE